MKQETFERLLIDRACGALSPDVEALVEAYLEMVPEQQRLADEITNTVNWTRLASTRPLPTSLPPLKLAPLRAELPPRFEVRRVGRLAELAAAFVLGAGLAVWAFHEQVRAPAPAPFKSTLASQTVGAGGSSPGFWSFKRLASKESRSSPREAPRVTWKSLTQNSQIQD